MFAAGPALGQVLPAAFQVVDVAPGDVLNIRAEPSASAPIIGSLPPGRTHVEVIELNPERDWGWVGTPEGNGWVSMRFLERQDAPTDRISRPFRCVGTEPFWSVTFDEAGVDYASPEGDLSLTPVSEAVAFDGYLSYLAGEDGAFWTLIADRDYCGDGMSERTYGWKVLIFRLDPRENWLLSGCCTLDAG